jgi:FG-GAP-like repeat/ASPIC and UnbV
MQSCWQVVNCHEEMISILKNVHGASFNPANQFHGEAKLHFMDSLLGIPHSSPGQIRYCTYLKANILMELGQEDAAALLFEKALKDANKSEVQRTMKDLAICYLRIGERSNCISNHAAESCILPIKGIGIHEHTYGSERAITLYEEILAQDPNDLESKWLLNLAYMTLGKYPDSVPKDYMIPNMAGDTTYKVKPFRDIAGELKLDVRNPAGGAITEDFDGDGYLDLMTSSMAIEEPLHFFHNNANGTFTDRSAEAGLKGITGGLNMIQGDYDNDGDEDVFVLRGGWKHDFGKEPNSLLKNNGDGTFMDVTTKSGLLSFHPTQTGVWNDFNNDGWLDLFIGNETSLKDNEEAHPCELYINNGDGTFREIGAQAHCDILNYVKSVASGDYDQDGWKDIFISTMDGHRRLLKNMGKAGQEIDFTDVTEKAGLKDPGSSFPSWFWDYDNDGWLDIFVCDYTFQKPLSYYTSAEKFGIHVGNPDKMFLYRNNHDGTFTNVARDLGLDKTAFAMGSNFGDIDNDGFLDIYLGTGNPDYKSLVPNKMFKNLGGKKFVDVTASARVGHLQKGHGVAFADMDNDGDQDIYIELGGAYAGDAYQNSFFLNPGQNDSNNWICLKLEGTKSVRDAIGSRVKLTFRENGVTRSVYRDVNSGGSFGCSPMRREIGIGQATIIDEIEIRWHGTDEIQRFTNVKPNQFLKIKEGNENLTVVPLKKLDWMSPDKLCAPFNALSQNQ